MVSVPAVSPMHEDVQEWTCENEEEGQKPKSVREVLGPEQDAADDQQDSADDKRTRRPEAALRRSALAMMRMVMCTHVRLRLLAGRAAIAQPSLDAPD
jgi:hypothetical protein